MQSKGFRTKRVEFVWLFFILVYFYFAKIGGGNIQSLTISGVLLIISVLVFSIGIVADSTRVNRMLVEEVLYKLKKKEFGNGK